MSERITHDKPYDLKGDVNARMINYIDEMFGQLYWSMAQLENKLSSGKGLLTSNNTSITTELDPGSTNITNWLTGPWTFGAGTTTSAYIDTGVMPTVTYHNFAPSGIDSAVVLDIEPVSAGVTLTGLKSRTDARFRMILIRNVDTSGSLTLKHLNSGSLGRNQFRLPSSTDIVVGPRQAVWLFFDASAGLWTSAITSHTSGGLALGDSLSLVELDLTEGQLENLNTTPIEIIAAPGAGKVIVPVQATFVLKLTSVYTNSPGVQLRY